MRTLFIVLVIMAISNFGFIEKIEGSASLPSVGTKKMNTFHVSTENHPFSTRLNLGKTLLSESGKRSLIKKIPINKVYFLDGIEYTINDIRFFHFSSKKRNIASQNSVNPTEYDYIELSVEMVNSKAKAVTFNPIDSISIEKNPNKFNEVYINEPYANKIAGGDTKKESIAFILDRPVDKIEMIKIRTSAVISKDQKILHGALSIPLAIK